MIALHKHRSLPNMWKPRSRIVINQRRLHHSSTFTFTSPPLICIDFHFPGSFQQNPISTFSWDILFLKMWLLNEFSVADLFPCLSARRAPDQGFSTKDNLPNCHNCNHQITLGRVVMVMVMVMVILIESREAAGRQRPSAVERPDRPFCSHCDARNTL